MRGKHGARAAARRTQQEYEAEIAGLQHRAAKAEGALSDCRAWIEGERRAHAAEVRELRERLREQRPPALIEAEREAERLRDQVAAVTADRDKVVDTHHRVFDAAVRYVAKREKLSPGLALEVVLTWVTGQRVTVGDWCTRNPEAARRLNLQRYGGAAKFGEVIDRSSREGWLSAPLVDGTPPVPMVDRYVAAVDSGGHEEPDA